MIDLAALAPEFQEYEDRWIAIDDEENKIIAVADSIREVDERATAKGFEAAFLFRVPRFDIGFAPSVRLP